MVANGDEWIAATILLKRINIQIRCLSGRKRGELDVCDPSIRDTACWLNLFLEHSIKLNQKYKVLFMLNILFVQG